MHIFYFFQSALWTTRLRGTVDELKFTMVDNGALSVMTPSTKQRQMSSVGCWAMARGLQEIHGMAIAGKGDKLHEYKIKLTTVCVRSNIIFHIKSSPSKITEMVNTHRLEGIYTMPKYLIWTTTSHAISTTATFAPIDIEWFVHGCFYFFLLNIKSHTNDLAVDCGNSTVNALELPRFALSEWCAF